MSITGPVNCPANTVWSLFNRSNDTINPEIVVHSVRATSKVLTPAEVRAEYLKGARKLVVDASIFSDGSCPVSIAAQTDGTIGPWTIKTGSWLIIEDAPTTPGIPGARRVRNSAGTPLANTRSESAYGSWVTTIKPVNAGSVMMVGFISDTGTGTGSATENGYLIRVNADESLSLCVVTAGVATALISTSASYVVRGTIYELWITRRFDGLFGVYIFGGAYTSWTMTGLNVTDTTHTTGGFMYIQGDTAASLDEWGGSTS